MSEFQKMNFEINLTEAQEKAKTELIQKLLQDNQVNALFAKNNIPGKCITTHPYRIDTWRKEIEPCIGCIGLMYCKQVKAGYVNDLEYDGILKVVQKPCKFKNEQLKKTAHLKNYLINDLPKNMQTIMLDEINLNDISDNYMKVYNSCFEAYNERTGMFLYGTMGVGKTFLAAAACNSYAKNNEKVAFVQWPSFVQKMASMVHTGEYRNELEKLKYARFVVIDEIGTETVTEWNRDTLLFPVLNARYDAGLPTWFTSNQNLETLENHYSISNRGKEEMLKAERIVERIRVSTKQEALTGKDRREIG